MSIGGWDGIEEFVAVARAGSFTAAARGFGASVTHMSRAVMRLEARIAAPLFHRTTRTLRLTDTGQALLDQCQRMVDERDEMLAAVSAGGEPRGMLRVTCSHALGERFVAPLLREFAQGWPGLSVTLDLDNTVTDLIGDGYDLAVRTGDLDDSRLVATRIASRALATVAAPGYLDARGRPRDLAELAAHDCLLGSSREWKFARGQRFRPQGRWRCNSGEAVVEAAIAGMGLCQVPEFYIGAHVAAGRLEHVLQPLWPEDEPIWAVWPERRHVPARVTMAVAHLRARLPRRLVYGAR